MFTRRQFLKYSSASISTIAIMNLLGCRSGNSDPLTKDPAWGLGNLGQLQPADQNGLMLPKGFSSRIIATSHMPVTGESSYIWHDAPDGGAVFSATDNGWIYVSNSEVDNNLGGVGAIKFDSKGNIIDSYSILSNTNRNCSGGATPWGTWLSCEETDHGTVWECDPNGIQPPNQLLSLGVFKHESATVDRSMNIYLTEDQPDGGLYRYKPNKLIENNKPDLENGVLEIATFNNGLLVWQEIPDLFATSLPTRYQIGSSIKFNGGEGIIYYNNAIFFATKGDNTIWKYDITNNNLEIFYRTSDIPNSILSGVDNMAVTPLGDIIVSEDGGDMQIVALTRFGDIMPIAQLIGHDKSELTGPAFSHDGTKLYFSSQRGISGTNDNGMTFEISGNFYSDVQL
ncbi:TPA: DUF839 domain-containing protein [Vibrio parahaemolyticus]|nr:DUF839 domain-containing protein [Vibrio parahaemolyticus]